MYQIGYYLLIVVVCFYFIQCNYVLYIANEFVGLALGSMSDLSSSQIAFTTVEDRHWLGRCLCTLSTLFWTYKTSYLVFYSSS
jgi:hypothetical protein